MSKTKIFKEMSKNIVKKLPGNDFETKFTAVSMPTCVSLLSYFTYKEWTSKEPKTPSGPGFQNWRPGL